MEVILREHVDNLGQRGDVVKVANGYARNFLLPRKLALPATDANRKHIQQEKKKVDAREADERQAATAVAERLAVLEVVVKRRVGETEALYGSVTAADIAEALAAQHFDVDKRKIQLPDPIKQIGEFSVPVRLHRDVTGHIKVRVEKEA
jgi:large subunit ribosomal protein L9